MTRDEGVTVGALIWTQHTDWPSLMAAGAAAERAGIDQVWTWDHLLPLHGRSAGPIFEALMTVAGWAAVTGHVTLGLMVAANTFRNPALLVKMVTALDHMSGGRAAFGLGAGWYEPEHRAFGIDMGAGIAERLDRLDEAALLVRDLLRDGHATARGRHYHAADVANDPPPIQARIPLLIGGGGERRTLATVARYADAWNAGGDLEEVRRKDGVLREWCVRVGRDESDIRRTVGVGPVVIRSSVEAARRAADSIIAHNIGQGDDARVGPSALIVEQLTPFVELGFRTIHFDVPAPFDRETLERMAGEVGPALSSLVGA
jgi:alkanesulfonate monooxygenase SsuD/methylene tetrahydromethanopterin reductase-like flavin-dependent oxidoreductase (luciferase family)